MLPVLATVAFALSAAASASAQHKKISSRHPVTLVSSHYTFPALAIDEVVRTSERIFSGRVISVKPISIRGLSYIEIRLAVVRPIKGDMSEVTVIQDPLVSSNVSRDDEVLWFLAGESEIGLSAPVGFASGHFMLRAGDLETGKFENLYRNRGLWNQTLWERVDFARVREILLSDPKLRVRSEQELESILAYGNRPPDAPLPIELLIAVSRALENTALPNH